LKNNERERGKGQKLKGRSLLVHTVTEKKRTEQEKKKRRVAHI